MKILSRTLYLSFFSTLIFILPAQAAKVERVELYPFIEYFTWSEFDEGERLLRETGPRLGFGARADIELDKQVLLRVRGDIHGGQVDYDGQTQSGIPVKTDVTYIGTRTEADLGFRYGTTGWQVKPFVGLGYRWWLRDIQNSATADGTRVTGYSESWHDLYTKFGITTEHKIGKEIDLTLEGGGKYSFYTLNYAGDEALKLEPQGQLAPFAEASLSLGRFRPAIFYEGYRYNKSPVVFEHPNFFWQPKSKADVFGINLYITIQ